ncbi:tetratricopeptide repeat protein [Fulvivirga lutea]|uniref:Tetratricopeptide repeat protein n=1 Tax=Fulvivirga lutea TaxID=2810512 RepID=A0A974WFV2_9BACT|nr:tetratricopeptide repeat protein [Fulvivirga lutea]QSE97260.1 tetratricopeptide repeat protein [Fulvivirga lutea]
MKKLVGVFILLLVAFICHGDIDSLKNELQKNTSKNNEFSIQLELLNAYYERGFNDEAIQLGEKLLVDPAIQNHDELKAKVANRLGTIYTNIGGKDNAALKYLTIALDIYREEGNLFGQGIIFNNLGNIYRDLAYDSKAMDYYLKSLEICREIKDKEGEAFALKNIGILYEYQGWYEKALEYHHLALYIREKEGSIFQIISSMLNVAISYNGLQEYEKALLTLERAQLMAEENKSELIDEILHEKGNAHFSLGIPDKARFYYEKAISQATTFKKYKVVCSTLEDLIRLNLINSEFEAMKNNLIRLKSLLDTISYVRGNVGYELLSYQLDSANNNELSALRHFQRMSRLNDSLYSVSNREDLIQQRSALELLQTENELELERTKQKFQSKIYIYIVGFLTITLLGLSYIVYVKLKSNRKLNKQKAEISHKNKKLKKLNDQLNDTVEELRSANETIENQNKIISQHNEKLEEMVTERTKKVVDYSNKLEEYAFHTAHNLRAPVARLLGLTNLFNISTDEKEKQVLLEKIVKETEEIDSVIHTISVILDETAPLKNLGS